MSLTSRSFDPYKWLAQTHIAWKWRGLDLDPNIFVGIGIVWLQSPQS